MIHATSLGACVALVSSIYAAHWVAPASPRVTLPVIERGQIPTEETPGTCTVEVSRAPLGGVNVRVKTTGVLTKEGGYDQPFSLADGDLPLSTDLDRPHARNDFADSLSYDGSTLRFEYRSTAKPTHAMVYEVAVDPALRVISAVRITDYDGADPAYAPVRHRVECESRLN